MLRLGCSPSLALKSEAGRGGTGPPVNVNPLRNTEELIMPRIGWKQGATALAVGIVLGTVGAIPVPSVDVSWKLPAFQKTDYVPSARRDSGEELLFIVVGSSGCRWSNTPELVQLVRRAREAVREEAETRGAGFATLGVAQDNGAQLGIEHLEKFGPFDELSVGRGWRNSGLLKYVYGAFPGPAVTPQILVMSRDLVGDGGQWEIANETQLLRLTGLAEIRSWVQGGANVS